MKNYNSALEICCYSIKSAKIAESAGADRIELCSGILEGGITPSIGLIESVLKNTTIPVRVIIRPRGGDFLYNDEDFEVMKNDIVQIKKLQPDGFVIGILKSDGNLDYERMKVLCDLALPHKVTFHRAFDMCSNPHKTIDELVSLGVDLILTSGQRMTALSGVNNLTDYVHYAEGRIKIMAGSGVSFKNIDEIRKKSLVKNFHLSAKVSVKSEMVYINDAVKMGSDDEDEYQTYEADFDLIKKAKLVLENQN